MRNDTSAKKPAAKPVQKAAGKAPKKATVKMEKNTDELEKPHRVPGKPYHYSYK
jgi:hypothetical protein